MKTKNTIKSLFYISLLLVVAGYNSSCYSSMDDISQNPNKTTKVHPKSIFTYMCITTFSIDFYGIQPSRTAWQWDGRSGGGTLNFLRRGWSGEYSRVAYVYEMDKEADRVGDKRYVHLGAFFRSYWYFNTTRLFGDIPYSEGANGRVKKTLTPKYDKQEDVIYGLLTELSDANDALAEYDGTIIGGDIIYGGNVKQWRRLINMYRLRILMSCSMNSTINGNSVADMFDQIISDPAKNPIMERFEDSAILDEGGRQEPYIYYNENNFVSSYRLTKNIVEMMKDRGDMRLTKMANVILSISDPTPAQIADLSKYEGVIPNPGPTDDTNNTSSMNSGAQSLINSRWNMEMTGPNHIAAGYAEQEFIIAEAILRGWTNGDINKHYKNGITAAFKNLDIATSDLNTYLSNAKVALSSTDSDSQKLKKIITEKYLNFFLNAGFEPYFDLRRTGYPDFMEYLPHQYTTYIYNDGYLPLRYLYPTNEVMHNNKNMTEAVNRLDKGDDENSKMWLVQGSDPLFNPSPFPFR